MYAEDWLDEEYRRVEQLIDSLGAIKASFDTINIYVDKTDETIAKSGKVLNHWAQLLRKSAQIATVLGRSTWYGLDYELESRRKEELKRIELEEEREQAEQEAKLLLEQQAEAERAQKLAEKPMVEDSLRAPKRMRLGRPAGSIRRRTVAFTPQRRASLYDPHARQYTSKYI